MIAHQQRCDLCTFFVRMLRFLLTLDTIDVLRLNKFLKAVRNRTFYIIKGLCFFSSFHSILCLHYSIIKDIDEKICVFVFLFKSEVLHLMIKILTLKDFMHYFECILAKITIYIYKTPFI